MERYRIRLPTPGNFVYPNLETKTTSIIPPLQGARQGLRLPFRGSGRGFRAYQKGIHMLAAPPFHMMYTG